MMNETLVQYALYLKVKTKINVVAIKYSLLHVIYYITLPNILDDMRKKQLYEKKDHRNYVCFFFLRSFHIRGTIRGL